MSTTAYISSPVTALQGLSISSSRSTFLTTKPSFIHHARVTRSMSPFSSQARAMTSTTPLQMGMYSAETANTIEQLPLPSLIHIKDYASFDGQALIVAVQEPETDEAKVDLSEAAKAWDAKLGGAIADLIQEEKFRGKTGSSVSTRIRVANSPVKFIAVFGIGKVGGAGNGNGSEEDTKEKDSAVPQPRNYGGLFSSAVNMAKSSKAITKVGILGVEDWAEPTLALAAEHITSAHWKDDRFKGTMTEEAKKKSGEEELAPATYAFLGPAQSTVTSIDGAVKRGTALARGVMLTRQLVNAPPNVVNPVSLAKTAQEIAARHSDVFSAKILEREDCEKLGMGAFLAVARGSHYPPKFIHLTYSPPGGAKKKIAFIGKGLTFDSGGYNIKTGPASLIHLMKFDMGGAAAVLGAAAVIGALKPKDVEVHFVIATCENMIDSNAYRPGDIITASNGITIEIGNTDAEGRLTLADALVYVEKLGKLECIVDMATLTGAIIVSLGGEYAGLFVNRDDFADKLIKVAKQAKEKVWRLPMPEEYLEMTKGKLADLKNVGGSGGGSITAALFLKQFVKDTPWAHVDIAGTVWSEKSNGPTGYGVKLFVNLAESYIDQQ
eukprot:CAMPEP_0184694226 /NCGR_PEP_ID=MMETSP0313-20130426/2254_1 /TAXON_ID=2792 /ORGANISM="Porphyridium aerugineum, Strain SAG 1380-2" /LENGTH=607 /DNA_ID=CAMNT_0027152483 /DNA_START=1 /DNA_END=1824 /DNA_ORIENTATION=-